MKLPFVFTAGLLLTPVSSIFLQKPVELEESCSVLGGKAQMRSESGNWQADEAVTVCNGCQQKFNLLHRKHHCRICGNIFCHACSRRRPEYGNERMCYTCHLEKAADQYDFGPQNEQSNAATKEAEAEKREAEHRAYQRQREKDARARVEAKRMRDKFARFDQETYARAEKRKASAKAAEAPQTKEQFGFHVGDKVVLHGLEKRLDLNGMSGRVVGFEGDRMHIQINVPGQSQPYIGKFKSANVLTPHDFVLQYCALINCIQNGHTNIYKKDEYMSSFQPDQTRGLQSVVDAKTIDMINKLHDFFKTEEDQLAAAGTFANAAFKVNFVPPSITLTDAAQNGKVTVGEYLAPKKDVTDKQQADFQKFCKVILKLQKGPLTRKEQLSTHPDKIVPFEDLVDKETFKMLNELPNFFLGSKELQAKATDFANSAFLVTGEPPSEITLTPDAQKIDINSYFHTDKEVHTVEVPDQPKSLLKLPEDLRDEMETGASGLEIRWFIHDFIIKVIAQENRNARLQDRHALENGDAWFKHYGFLPTKKVFVENPYDTRKIRELLKERLHVDEQFVENVERAWNRPKQVPKQPTLLNKLPEELMKIMKTGASGFEIRRFIHEFIWDVIVEENQNARLQNPNAVENGHAWFQHYGFHPTFVNNRNGKSKIRELLKDHLNVDEQFIENVQDVWNRDKQGPPKLLLNLPEELKKKMKEGASGKEIRLFVHYFIKKAIEEENQTARRRNPDALDKGDAWFKRYGLYPSRSLFVENPDDTTKIREFLSHLFADEEFIKEVELAWNQAAVRDEEDGDENEDEPHVEEFHEVFDPSQDAWSHATKHKRGCTFSPEPCTIM